MATNYTGKRKVVGSERNVRKTKADGEPEQLASASKSNRFHYNTSTHHLWGGGRLMAEMEEEVGL